MADGFCFGTLAVGDRYRKHAKLLAQDIQNYAPTQRLIVLSDRPEDFQNYPQVLAVLHQLQSVKGYHDKRFVLEKALSLFKTCVLVDADVRIIGSVFTELTWPPGITARTGCSVGKHLKNIHKSRKTEILQAAAQHLNLEIENVPWLHEFLFAMTHQQGKEKEFFQLWQTISYFLESQGMYDGEGYAIGFAAAKVGLDFGYDRTDWFPFFKDNIEKVRIKNGQSKFQDKKQYFEQHRQIENVPRSVPQKVWAKLKKSVVVYPRLLRLRKQKRQDMYYQKLFGNE